MDDDIIYGRVYWDEADRGWHYHCDKCSISYYGSNQYLIEDRADKHEDNHMKAND